MIVPKSVYRNRPTKLAKGMTKTFYRSNHRIHSDDANSLSVTGTLDKLHTLRFFYFEKATSATCPCCGNETRKYKLNEKGRRKLAAMKRRWSKP